MKDRIKVYFLGSGEIAVPVLDALTKADRLCLAGIGTQQDRPAGRKRALTPTPVGRYAAEHGLAADKPASVNDDCFIDYLRGLEPAVILVVSYGQLLKERVLALPGFCCLNVHASLLPLYRGASPIAGAILNRDKKTGVSFMAMDKGLDTGKVYYTIEMKLDGSEYADALELKLGKLAAGCVEKVICGIVGDGWSPVPQDDSKASLTRKTKKEDGRIDWNRPALELETLVRAYYPWPGAVFELALASRSIQMIVTGAGIAAGLKGEPGEILQADKNGWIIACGKDALVLSSVIPQGKKEMSGAEFLNGCRLEPGFILR